MKTKKRLLWIPAGLLLLAALFAALLFLVNRFSVTIVLRGKPEITLEYGEQFEDPGADAHLVGTLLCKGGYPAELTTDSTVDTQKLGTYRVRYSAKCLWFTRNAERIVHIIDSTPPVLELLSSPETFTIPGEAYAEEGYTASDNCDGDLTDRVLREERDGVVTYRVADASGNETVVTREIVYFDPIAPVLTLSGAAEIVLTVGEPFVEPGYTASDNCDGDLTAQVEISGSVDVSQPGEYTLRYRVEDSYGNPAEASRTVTVEPLPPEPTPEPVPIIVPEGSVIYLTFDDGPGANTNRLLDILGKYDVKATFFVVDNGSYDTMRRIAQEGHTLAMHASSHNYRQIYASEEAYFADLDALHSVIARETGVDATLLRFPGGSSNTASSFNPGIMTRLTQAVTEKGLSYFDWNVDSNDAGGASSADEVFRNIVNGVSGRKLSYVLQHDIKGFSIDAVERVIQWGLERGYAFLPLTADSPYCHHRVSN